MPPRSIERSHLLPHAVPTSPSKSLTNDDVTGSGLEHNRSTNFHQIRHFGEKDGLEGFRSSRQSNEMRARVRNSRKGQSYGHEAHREQLVASAEEQRPVGASSKRSSLPPIIPPETKGRPRPLRQSRFSHLHSILGCNLFYIFLSATRLDAQIC